MKCPGFLCHTDRRGELFPHTEPLRCWTGSPPFSRTWPAWPQMPVGTGARACYVQYSEGLPGAGVVDRAAQTIYFRRDEACGRAGGVLQALVDEDVERFAVSREYAAGLHLSWESVPRLGGQRPEVGQRAGHRTPSASP